MFPKPISLLGMEKLNQTEQKHAFSNQKKCITTQNKNLVGAVQLKNVSISLEQAALAVGLHEQSLKVAGVISHHRRVNARNRQNRQQFFTH